MDQLDHNPVLDVEWEGSGNHLLVYHTHPVLLHGCGCCLINGEDLHHSCWMRFGQGSCYSEAQDEVGLYQDYEEGQRQDGLQHC